MSQPHPAEQSYAASYRPDMQKAPAFAAGGHTAQQGTHSFANETNPYVATNPGRHHVEHPYIETNHGIQFAYMAGSSGMMHSSRQNERNSTAPTSSYVSTHPQQQEQFYRPSMHPQQQEQSYPAQRSVHPMEDVVASTRTPGPTQHDYAFSTRNPEKSTHNAWGISSFNTPVSTAFTAKPEQKANKPVIEFSDGSDELDKDYSSSLVTKYGRAHNTGPPIVGREAEWGNSYGETSSTTKAAATTPADSGALRHPMSDAGMPSATASHPKSGGWGGSLHPSRSAVQEHAKARADEQKVSVACGHEQHSFGSSGSWPHMFAPPAPSQPLMDGAGQPFEPSPFQKFDAELFDWNQEL